MMMFQDNCNEIREQHKNPKNPINEASKTPEPELPSEIKKVPQTKVQDREHLEQHSSGQPAAVPTKTQSQPPMPTEEQMRHSIADSLMELLVNMTNSQYRRECLELLEAGDPLQARSQILDILQRIDGERSTQQP